MTFDALRVQVLDLLQCEGLVSYRALKRRFDLADDLEEVGFGNARASVQMPVSCWP